MILAIASAALRLLLTAMTVLLLTHRQLADVFNRRERIGLGLLGGSGFMTIPVILDVNKEGTPFDVIAGLAFSLGAIVFLWGFTDRKLGHARRNQEQIEAAERHFAGKANR